MAEITETAGQSVLENIAVWEQNEVSLEKTNLSDSFFVDIENLSPNAIKDKHSASSIISVKLQRKLSRKGSPRDERSKTTLVSSTGLKDGSSKVTAPDWECDHIEKSTGPAPTKSFGMTETTLDRQPQQTIAITAENRSSSGKYWKRRTSIIDPKRVLFFFATLSSMGSMLLIYYTLSIRKFSGDDSIQA